MKRQTGSIVALIVLCACSAAAASHDRVRSRADTSFEQPKPPGDTYGATLNERLDWVDPGLELFLWDRGAEAGFVKLRFALQLKAGLDVARTWIGFPRYSTVSSTSWRDAVYQGPHGRNRVMEVSVHTGGRSFFSVMVPHDAAHLTLPIGDETLLLDLDRWLSATAPRRAIYGRSEERQPRFDRPRSADEPLITEAPPIQDSLPPYVAEESFPSEPPGQPVRLEVDLRWLGEKPFGDGALDAGESGEILVDVINDGPRPARDVVVRISPAQIPNVSFPAEVRVPTIDPGLVETVAVPFRGEPGLSAATVPVTVRVVEPFGHDGPPIEFELTTRGAPLAQLMLVDDFALEGAGLPVPRDSIVSVRLRVRNMGQGLARDVVAHVQPGEGVFAAQDSADRFELDDLEPGEIAEFVYRCYANRRAEQMVLQVELSDEGGAAVPVESQVVLPLEEFAGPARIVRVAADPSPRIDLPPAPAPMTADIDKMVPRSRIVRPDALAVVLGVESYLSAPRAVFSADDARTAARYFEHALGIPSRRIQLLLDEEVTLAQLQRIFGKDGWLARRMHETTELFVFFAGHGIAAPGDFDPYLIPSDGDLDYVQQTGFPLDLLIERLAELDARHTTIFIDACFSGLTRDGGALLDGARPLALVPAKRKVSGVSLFSAARGTQIAGAYNDQGHGLFSYFLFKGLGGSADLDRDGTITAAELGTYLQEAVTRTAAELDREQNPSVILEDPRHVLVEF
jgi:hypothetical protein